MKKKKKKKQTTKLLISMFFRSIEWCFNIRRKNVIRSRRGKLKNKKKLLKHQKNQLSFRTNLFESTNSDMSLRSNIKKKACIDWDRREMKRNEKCKFINPRYYNFYKLCYVMSHWIGPRIHLPNTVQIVAHKSICEIWIYGIFKYFLAFIFVVLVKRTHTHTHTLICIRQICPLRQTNVHDLVKQTDIVLSE